MNEQTHWRKRVKSELERYFKRRSLPRFALGLILTVTGLVGFLISFLLLRAGMHAMWIRYPIAVLGTYGCFLGFLRIWVEIERHRFDLKEEELQELAAHRESTSESPAQHRSVDGSWVEDVVNVGVDFDEGCLPVILIGVVVALIGVFVLALMNAPALLSEVFLDTFLVSALYRRLRIASKEHWLGSALKQTWALAFTTAILLSVGGACLQMMAPGARSIGPAIQRIFHPDNTQQLEDEI